VNGKLRATFECEAGTAAAELEGLALAQPRVVELLAGRPPRKVVAVPDRIVNLVV
jgi:leucyl-tRNA synthetase